VIGDEDFHVNDKQVPEFLNRHLSAVGGALRG